MLQRIYQPFYTNSEPIVRFMLRMLDVQPGSLVLEPCGGDGVFVSALLEAGDVGSIDVYEIDPAAHAILVDKFDEHPQVSVKYGDVLTDETLSCISSAGGSYDRIVANPPYGAWQDYDKRSLLKVLYPGAYVKETYTLFMLRALNLLRDGGRFVFIVPETFLALHRHKGLREALLLRSRILDVRIFPSSFFPNVNFGYSRLAIITVERCSERQQCLENRCRILTGFRSPEELNTESAGLTNVYLRQDAVFAHPEHAFLLSNGPVSDLVAAPALRIEHVADCVTGFYSGNDMVHLRVAQAGQSRSGKYREVRGEAICDEPQLRDNILAGLDGPRQFVPIMKGGGIKYHKPNLWYMDWSTEAVKGYRTNKKARFQNPRFYFQQGIGVPMVSSKQITAALIDHRLFDQSIVGVFPKHLHLLAYLLAFFNTPTCNQLIRAINPSANNSANYIKKIPFIPPSTEELNRVTSLVGNILTEVRQGRPVPENAEREIADLFCTKYGV